MAAIDRISASLDNGDPPHEEDLLDFAHEADGGKGALSKMVEGGVGGAATGAAAAEAVAVAIDVVALALETDVATAAAAAAAAGTAIATGVGTGASLGATLGPFGAAVGAVIGVIVALVEIGGAKGANAGWCDPSNSVLGALARDYFTQNPVNPLVAILLEHADNAELAIVRALAGGAQGFDWSPFEAVMREHFKLSADGLRFESLLRLSPVTAAFNVFFRALRAKRVPLKVAKRCAYLFADFAARVRGAEHAFTANYPGSVGDLSSDMRTTDPTCAAWIAADSAAADWFNGGAGWKWQGEGVGVGGTIHKTDAWPHMAGRPYFDDVFAAVLALVDAAYGSKLANSALSGQLLSKGLMAMAKPLAPRGLDPQHGFPPGASISNYRWDPNAERWVPKNIVAAGRIDARGLVVGKRGTTRPRSLSLTAPTAKTHVMVVGGIVVGGLLAALAAWKLL